MTYIYDVFRLHLRHLYSGPGQQAAPAAGVPADGRQSQWSEAEDRETPTEAAFVGGQSGGRHVSTQQATKSHRPCIQQLGSNFQSLNWI